MRGLFMLGLSWCVLLSSCATSTKSQVKMASPQEAKQLASDATIYAYPLVMLAKTRDVQTATPYTTKIKAPINQFVHTRNFPDENVKDTGLTTDVLYSTAWLDLADEPMVLTVPKSNRFYSLVFMNAWSDIVANLGSTETKNRELQVLLAGPNWKGQAPEGVRVVRIETNNAWLVTRIQGSSNKDFPDIHHFQNDLDLTPLSYYGKIYLPPSNVSVNPLVNSKTEPVAQMQQLDASTFFGDFAEELKNNKPLTADTKKVEELRRLGLNPGQAYHLNNLSQEMQAAINEGYQLGLQRLKQAATLTDEATWQIRVNANNDYFNRAVVAFSGQAINNDGDSIWLRTGKDVNGERLSGERPYVLHISKEQLPPAKGFWSLSMYDAANALVPNAGKRFNISSKEKLKYNGDGSLDLYIQETNPGRDRVANWLPAPAGNFHLVMRLYGAKQEQLSGWKLPYVEKAMESRLSKNVEF
ncbi:DUF1254 domain-containing protein [Bdellovibrio sp. NC01]|uniref:DUF1254 domain-containing protein n=1 Tax=Bdellovibrio sp. NC01 TaxID=2220073 RepID=UPI00143CD251|nr:DUF1254 domain-containing protein [Bdellovibrio sp. NC01]